jgi:hypothetical protein
VTQNENTALVYSGPSRSTVHAVDCTRDVTPAPHVAHGAAGSALEVSWNVPGAQGTQFVKPGAGRLPTAQQAREPSKIPKWVPAEHGTQSNTLAEPSAENMPARHKEQSVSPNVSENLPVGQSAHGVPGEASRSAWPVWHASQSNALVDPSAEYVPASQLPGQSVAPGASENLPVGHALQSNALRDPGAEYVPAMHVEQSAAPVARRKFVIMTAIHCDSRVTVTNGI